MTGLGETPWIDRNLAIAWDRIAAASPFGKAGLPQASVSHQHWPERRKVWADEYGCGHYGCVMPTRQEGVVVKLTSDPTEAHFVAAALELGGDGYQNAGIVQYYAIYQLSDATHRRRPIFILWREEAFDLGFPFIAPLGDRSYEARSMGELVDNLNRFKFQANEVRERLKKVDNPYVTVRESEQWANWAWSAVTYDDVMYKRIKGRMLGRIPAAQRVAYHLRACEMIVEVMENTYMNDTIGRALGYYLQNGLLMADVHGNNVGKVERHDEIYDGTVEVITDPGHAVPLIERWDSVQVQEI